MNAWVSFVLWDYNAVIDIILVVSPLHLQPFSRLESASAVEVSFFCSAIRKKKETVLKREFNIHEQSDLWNDIVEPQIFVNVRVKYSEKIAQRVLFGYNDRKINSSVIDVIKLLEELKKCEG